MERVHLDIDAKRSCSVDRDLSRIRTVVVVNCYSCDVGAVDGFPIRCVCYPDRRWPGAMVDIHCSDLNLKVRHALVVQGSIDVDCLYREEVRESRFDDGDVFGCDRRRAEGRLDLTGVDDCVERRPRDLYAR